MSEIHLMPDDGARPTISEHFPYVLAWMLANPGPQRRKDIQRGALEIAPWTDQQRELPPTSQKEGKFTSLLAQQVFYAVWHLRDGRGLIENAGRCIYVLTDQGREEAERQRAELHPNRVGRPFPSSRRVPDERDSGVLVFEYDPDARDRQTRAHEVLVHEIKDAIRAVRLQPLVPAGNDPLFDIAFYAEDGETLVIVEAKSLSGEHAVHQLRLGLGHVLHYAHLLGRRCVVRAALAVPNEPPDEWRSVCGASGVTLVVGHDVGDAIASLAAVEG